MQLVGQRHPAGIGRELCWTLAASVQHHYQWGAGCDRRHVGQHPQPPRIVAEILELE